MYLRKIVVRFTFYVKENLFTLTTTDYIMWRIPNYVLEFYFLSQARGFRNKADVLILFLGTATLNVARSAGCKQILFIRVEIIDKRHRAIYTSMVAIGCATALSLSPTFTTLYLCQQYSVPAT